MAARAASSHKLQIEQIKSVCLRAISSQTLYFFGEQALSSGYVTSPGTAFASSAWLTRPTSAARRGFAAAHGGKALPFRKTPAVFFRGSASKNQRRSLKIR
jgi:hypothetical protein